MTPLADLQQDFIGHLLGRPNSMSARVLPAARAGAETMLAIYRHAYEQRLVEVLGADFAKLKVLMGPERFQSLALDYIAAHPSSFDSVRWIGHRLAEFLRRRQAEDRAPADMVLADMAEFEWAINGAFDAPDAEASRLADLAAIPVAAWSAMRMVAHPSLHQIDLAYDVPATWLAIERGEEPAPAPKKAAAWLIWRRGLDVKFRDLPADEAWALSTARDGHDFGFICERLGRWGEDGQAAYRAAELIQNWIATGMIAGIETEALLSA